MENLARDFLGNFTYFLIPRNDTGSKSNIYRFVLFVYEKPELIFMFCQLIETLHVKMWPEDGTAISEMTGRTSSAVCVIPPFLQVCHLTKDGEKN